MHVERFVELAPLVGRREPHLVGVVDQRAGTDAEHRAPARHVVELLHAARERERVVIGQRHHAGAEPDMARALGRRRDEHLRAIDDLEAGRVVLADPGLVIVQLVEMDEQIHVALEREQRVLVHRMKRREEDAGLHIPVVGMSFMGPRPFAAPDGSSRGPINNRPGLLQAALAREAGDLMTPVAASGLYAEQ